MSIAVLCWGSAGVVAKVAIDAASSPFAILFYRMVLASLLVLPFVPKMIHGIKNPFKVISLIVLLEIQGTVINMMLLYAGLARTTALEASLIGTTVPIFVTLAGIFALKEREQPTEVLGLIIALVATIGLVLVPWLSQPAGTMELSSLIGNLLTLGAQAGGAIYFIGVKKYLHDVPK